MTGTAHHRPKRVTLFGAESTGKSTLAAQLGSHFNAVVVPEYGRTYTEQHGQNASTAEDMLNI
ncbi:MAG: AAA family ATPase, partial [Hyphomonadaceae bacterium]|nr:AAA family ATPase [Hyphomonadaceae bacterium]